MLLGRETEQDQLDALLRQARAGTSGVLVFKGDPGIGKTALLGYAAERGQSMRILRTTGIETEKELAFAGLYSLLHPLVNYLGSLPELHAAAVRAALGLSREEVPAERLAVAAGTHGLLTTAAEHGALLLLVDDVHWLDSASQEALTFALHRLGSDAIACVLTMRAGAAGPPGLPCRDVAGLGYEAAEQLIEDIAGRRPAPVVARRLHAETAGNPLALVELSATLTAEQLAGEQLLDMPLEPGAGALSRLADLLALTASAAVEAGRWSRALADGSQALDLALAARQTYTTCEALLILAMVEAPQGRAADCVRHAREADRLTGELGLPLLQFRVRSSLALLELGQGKLEQAITHYEDVRRMAAGQGFADAFTSPVPDLIEAYARADAIDQARALLPEYLALVTGDASPHFAAVAARCQGIVAADGFDAYFLEAIRLHERSPVAFQHARTHLCYGKRLRRARRRRDARIQFRAAMEIFDRLDARPWAERTRAELRATGDSTASLGISGEQLTPQELQIALLVSRGRTNAEVGQAVFLSTRTVEFHLSRAYRKLGIASRTELTRRLASAGVVPADIPAGNERR